MPPSSCLDRTVAPAPLGVLLGHVTDTVCDRTARSVLCVKRKGEVVNLLHALLQLLEFEEE